MLTRRSRTPLPPSRRRWRLVPALLLHRALSGCTGFGPQTMRYQQADYAAALADAGKRQTLLNIVKLRYGDVPAFVTVNQILAGYSLQGTFSAGTELLTGGSLRLSDDANIGVGGTFTNSPTITYAPVTGADFARTFLAPMQPADLFGLMLAEHPGRAGAWPGAALARALQQRAGDGRRTAAGPAVHRGAGPAARAAARRPAADPAHRASARIASPRSGSASATPTSRPSGGCAACWSCPTDRDTFELVYSLGGRSPGRSRSGPARSWRCWASSPPTSTVPEGDFVDGRTEPG